MFEEPEITLEEMTAVEIFCLILDGLDIDYTLEIGDDTSGLDSSGKPTVT